MADFKSNYQIPLRLDAPPHQRMAFQAIMRGRNLKQAEIDRFRDQGVYPLDLFKSWSTQVDRVTFNGEYFEFADEADEGGEQVFTMGVISEMGLIDVVAWHPLSGRMATWLGLGFGLNEVQIGDHVDNASVGLAVFRSPLDCASSSGRPRRRAAGARETGNCFAGRSVRHWCTQGDGRFCYRHRRSKGSARHGTSSRSFTTKTVRAE